MARGGGVEVLLEHVPLRVHDVTSEEAVDDSLGSAEDYIDDVPEHAELNPQLSA